ncbi:hypothetical protein CEXT_136151 [Caerostris extrusa]|uniref:Secreted protein n=1 Tax=Caerostris extrusa TaxID=172846 RepID=A0AAV4SMN4_CAEEX|nr:hypothetical protein CEXT_136151 [Caerostris extrusa]
MRPIFGQMLTGRIVLTTCMLAVSAAVPEKYPLKPSIFFLDSSESFRCLIKGNKRHKACKVFFGKEN